MKNSTYKKPEQSSPSCSPPVILGMCKICNQELDDIDKCKCKLYVSDENIETYKEVPKWKNFLLIE